MLLEFVVLVSQQQVGERLCNPFFFVFMHFLEAEP